MIKLSKAPWRGMPARDREQETRVRTSVGTNLFPHKRMVHATAWMDCRKSTGQEWYKRKRNREGNREGETPGKVRLTRK